MVWFLLENSRMSIGLCYAVYRTDIMNRHYNKSSLGVCNTQWMIKVIKKKLTPPPKKTTF